MATVARQPFAPLHSSRLHNLTSLKNRQNALSSPGKRKASHLDIDDSENVDPLFFAKRSKGGNAEAPSKDALKATFALNTTSTLKASSANSGSRVLASPVKKASSAPRRSNPYAKTPIDKINTTTTSAPKSSAPATAPAGRSPTSRTKRSGILSSRRRGYGRVDPPSFGQTTSGPFSLDAALKGTLSNYSSRPASSKKSSSSAIANLLQPEAKASWFFDIHEDTPEQEMTNLLQHSTCVLDISSDEETEERASRDRDEGRNKENIPPADHVSQASTRQTSKAAHPDDMIVEEERVALGEINATEFYPEGCDESSVILILDDGEDDAATIVGEDLEISPDADFADAEAETEVEADDDELEAHIHQDIDSLMSRLNDKSCKAAVLQPIEGTGESFELWESDSTKDENEAVIASS